MARAIKLKADTIKKLEEAIQLGATYELACKHAGITYQTFRNWVKRAEEELERLENGGRKRKAAEPYLIFLETIKSAEGRAAVGWLEKIERASDEGAWQAAAWKLERRYPHDYGKQIKELTGPGGGPLRHAFTIDDLMAARSELDQWQDTDDHDPDG